jgi:hypothetical protein
MTRHGKKHAKKHNRGGRKFQRTGLDNGVETTPQKKLATVAERLDDNGDDMLHFDCQLQKLDDALNGRRTTYKVKTKKEIPPPAARADSGDTLEQFQELDAHLHGGCRFWAKWMEGAAEVAPRAGKVNMALEAAAESEA